MMKVAISGARGTIGSILRPALHARGIPVRSAGGSRPLEPLFPGEDVMHGDLRDSSVVDRLLSGVDVLVHLAGTASERPLAEIIDNNIVALQQVYEGARRNGVRRVVYASSNHAFGMHSVRDRLALDAPFRADSLYGLSKVWGEAMARMYWDKYGIESISVRIGTASGKPPSEPRHLSTWLGNEDLVELMLRCIEAPAVGYLAVWGVSANTRSYWDNTGAERLGYSPRQNAEDFASEIADRPNPLDPIAQRYQGGGFVTIDFTRREFDTPTS